MVALRTVLPTLAKSLAHRIGTAAGSALVGFGLAAPDLANDLAIGLTAAALIAFDLIWERR